MNGGQRLSPNRVPLVERPAEPGVAVLRPLAAETACALLIVGGSGEVRGRPANTPELDKARSF